MNEQIGTTGLPLLAHNELSDLIKKMSEIYEFKHGATAAFWHIALALSCHLGEPK